MVLPYKSEAYCSTDGRCTVGFPFLQSLEARKAQRYKWRGRTAVQIGGVLQHLSEEPKRVVSKRVILADVPPERKPERGYVRMFPRNENRNEGTFACSPGTKTGTRVHSPKPPFYETTLLSPGELSPRPVGVGGFRNSSAFGAHPKEPVSNRLSLERRPGNLYWRRFQWVHCIYPSLRLDYV